MKINNNKELWSEWMGDHIFANSEVWEDSKVSETFSRQLLKKWIFKGTECGCVFKSDEKGIMVGGYNELGESAELPMHDLEWGFTIEEFNEALDYADKEGCIAWHEAHDQDLGNMITEEEWKDGTF